MPRPHPEAPPARRGLVKSLSPTAHIFDLGDKPGPLDRRGATYQNWNTDSYTFQERQDPLYKDIPFFLIYDSGHASGVFMDNTWRSTFDFGVDDARQMSFGNAHAGTMGGRFGPGSHQTAIYRSALPNAALIYALYLHGGRNAVARRNTDDAAIIPGIPECRKRVRAGPTGAGRIHVGP
ncbi:hypothetical protein AA12717_1019 [Gluconacetobacter sacchari DSM 12717]|uniref:Glycoside hydrolase family 31 N-terminal domain-containing protein n=1 Tax=Gluconacetobacter sacchari DSM 12717 TaxID=1307940 RepID=A0ABQ0P4Q7_9PROT|nr:hypothetical protein AA12717_1019 [Gluconacetobacter sacchari DSM 12717]